MSRKIKLQQFDVQSAEDFDEHVLAASSDRLVVLDIYKDWSGPCEIMQPTFEYLLINIDNAPSLISFVTIDQEKLQKFLPSSATSNGEKVVPDNHGCRPIFALVKDEKVQKTVVGCNAPLIIQTVTSILDVEL